MAIASPTAPTFSTSFCCNRADSTRATCITLTSRALSTTHRLAISSSLNSSKPSGAGGEFNQYELQYGFAATRRRNGGSPVFVALPVDSVGVGGEVRRKKAMFQSFKALVAAGVEGVVMEVWWGVVERERPGVYDWRGYLEVVSLARRCGLKVRAVLAFHQCGTGPGDPRWIPLPLWVLEEIDKDPDIAYSDRLGRRSLEYISLGCDTLPVLRGRSPLQVYSDFMKNFRDTFWSLLGLDITGIQVGMGPGGELRYPSCPSEKLAGLYSNALGEFQCYDKYMLASLNACALARGMHGWENGMSVGVSDLANDPENTEFFRKDDGFWNKPYGRFFLEWYSGMLLRHGERICQEAEEIFRGIDVNTSAKVARIHWHYGMVSHASELRAGYYNTLTRDGYLPIARMFGRYKFGLCCSGFELRDVKERPTNISSPEGLLRQLLLATRICELPLEGENSSANLDDGSFQQVIKMSKFYSDGLERPCFSFNFMRMGKNMFEPGNWVRFTRFVRHMSGINLSRAKLDFGGDARLNHKQDAVGYGVVFAYC